MDGIFGNLINAIAEIWKTIGVAQKVSIILIGMLAIGVTAGIIYWGSQPEWGVLYANLDSVTASKVNDLVSESGVPVKLTDSGRTIMVPRKEINKLRLKVVGKGISVEKTGVGWDLFDNMKLGMTEQQQDVAFQRALQGELEKMIMQMPGVSSVKVTLNPAKKKVFRKEKSHPSVGIMLTMTQGRTLSTEQVNSIRYLVSSSVSDMRPQDVTVIDNNGKPLAKQVSDEEMATGDLGGQLEAQLQTERVLKDKAEAILRPLVGDDKVVAMVTCEIDFNSIDRIKEEYDDTKKATLSEKIVNEDNKKMSESTGGQAGMAGNQTIPKVGDATPAMSQVSGETGSSENRKTEERKYAVPKTVEKTTEKGGKIKKVSVAVSIGKKKDGVARDVAELQKLEELVVAAVGTTKENVKVQEMDFLEEKPQEYKAPILDTMSSSVEKFMDSSLIRPILGLALLFVLYRIFKRYFNKTSVEGSELAPGAVYSQEVKHLPGGAEAQQHSELENLMDSLQTKTSASPQNVAHLMENWLAADQG